jgi:D-amino peptidase
MVLCRSVTVLALAISLAAGHATSAAPRPSPFKVFISADMEGVAGVVANGQTGVEGRDYSVFREIMTAEVNAAIAAAYDAGATDVAVIDAHGGGTNLRPADVDRRATLISGAPMPMGMMTGIDSSFAAVIFIGYHASASAADAILGHTYTTVLKAVRLNGQEVGEWGLNAALAGYYGVPLVFASGDRALVEQVHAVLPEVETVAVKEGVSSSAAKILHPEIARERIAAGVRKALTREQPIAPWQLSKPVTLEVELATAAATDLAMLVPAMKRVSGRVVSYEAPDMRAAYRVSVLLDVLTSR